MGIIDLLKGIEKLAVELLLWFIYIPRTIFKIIKDPGWVPGYVHNELSKDDKFKGYMSPVLLFLGITVVLFVLLDSGIITNHTDDQKLSSVIDHIQDVVGLLFLTIPLFFALFTEIFRNGGLTREGILQNLYVQCYYLSPVMLSFFVYSIASQFDLESTFNADVSDIPLFLFSLTLLWFIIVQVKYISSELRYHKVIGFGIILLWFMIIGAGYFTYDELFSPVIVDKGKAGEEEILTMTLPRDDEYSIHISDQSFSADSLAVLNDYVISLENKNLKKSADNEGLNLIHNQTLTDTIGTQLRFWFNGVKGDQVAIHLTNLVFKNQMLITLWTKSPSEDLLFNDQGLPTDIWSFNQDEAHPITDIFFSLPETGKYHLIFNELTNFGEKYSVGFYKNDYFGATQNEDFGNISYGTKYSGLFAEDDRMVINKWKFKGNSGDEIEINLKPILTNDLAFDVVDSSGKSIVPVDKTLAANLIHWLYVIFFGYVIIIGFKAFFRYSKNTVVINENEGSKTGKILAIIVMVVTAMMIVSIFVFG